MALENENGMVMPVQPMNYGYAGYPMYGGFGNGLGGDFGSLIILFLFAAMFGGFGGGWGGNFGGDGAFPWLLASNANSQNATQNGFDQVATNSALSGIQNSIASGFANAEVANCGRTINSMERSFATQTATTDAINGVAAQLANCCCENRLATANLSALVQSENCADREALSNGIRDIITAQTAGTQKILDTLCQDKIDAKNEKIQELQTQITMQNLAASQAAQTAQLIQDNNAQTAALINRIAPYPQPSFIVGNPYFSGYYGGCCGGVPGFNGNV